MIPRYASAASLGGLCSDTSAISAPTTRSLGPPLYDAANFEGLRESTQNILAGLTPSCWEAKVAREHIEILPVAGPFGADVAGIIVPSAYPSEAVIGGIHLRHQVHCREMLGGVMTEGDRPV